MDLLQYQEMSEETVLGTEQKGPRCGHCHVTERAEKNLIFCKFLAFLSFLVLYFYTCTLCE